MRTEIEVPHLYVDTDSYSIACSLKASCHAIRKLVNFVHRAVREAYEVINSLARVGTTVAVLCIDAYFYEVPKLPAVNISLRC